MISNQEKALHPLQKPYVGLKDKGHQGQQGRQGLPWEAFSRPCVPGVPGVLAVLYPAFTFRGPADLTSSLTWSSYFSKLSANMSASWVALAS